jgi:DHA1 family tetracycline resistance protein-like MFS transporter
MYAIMQFLFAPVMGNLSDRFGRRPVLLGSLFGFGIDYLFLAFSPTIWWLFIGRTIAGITGASYSTATAYIADISEPEKRAQNFGLVGAAFGMGFIIGPVIGGLLGQFSVRLPFFAAAGFSLLNFLYGFFILPESLPKENRRSFEWKRANPLGSLIQLKKYPALISLAVAFFLLSLAGQATQSTWPYFTMYKFHWDEKWVGYSLGFVGLTVGIVQGGLIRIIIPKLGQQKSIVTGMILFCISFALFAFANHGWMMFAFMVPYALGGIAGPSMQSLMSAQVEPNAQGELQGALTSLMSLGGIIGPLMMTGLFAYFTRSDGKINFPGAAFLAGSLLTFAATLIAVKGFKKVKRNSEVGPL